MSLADRAPDGPSATLSTGPRQACPADGGWFCEIVEWREVPGILRAPTSRFFDFSMKFGVRFR